MATKQQKLEVSRLKQRVFNVAEDGELLSDMLSKLVDISEITDVSGTNLSTVPASFATLGDVQTYLSTVIPEIESRLDTIESKINEIKNV